MCSSDLVDLKWSTSQEINSSLFEIERSSGNNSWEKIAEVNAAGNSSQDIQYSFTDRNSTGSLLLYRLKQVDIDNNYKYSGIVRISNKIAEGISSYPNPFHAVMSVSIPSTIEQTVTINIYDVSGAIRRRTSVLVHTGNNSVAINDMAGWAAGLYFVDVKDNNGLSLGKSSLIKN